MNKSRRWLKSILATSKDMTVTLPWARGQRRRPAAVTAAQTRKPGIAAR